MSLTASVSAIGICAALFVLVWQAPAFRALSGLENYLPLHTIMETFAVVVAGLIFGIGWNAYSGERPGNYVILAGGFLVVGLLDIGHFLSYPGMPAFFTPSGTEKAIDFWLAARLAAAATLLAVAWLPWKPFVSSYARPMLMGGVLTYGTLAYGLILFHPGLLPDTFITGVGLTPFKVGVEYFIAALHLGTAWLFFRQGLGGRGRDPYGLLTVVAIMALSELCFTLYSDATDVFNLLGHIYKVIAYGLLYRAVFLGSVREPYERLHQSERAVWRAKELAEVTLHSIGDAVITADAGGRVEYLNPVAEYLTGWSRDEARGEDLRRVFSIVNEDTREMVENPVAKCLREGVVVGLGNHTALIRRDGAEFAIEDSAAPIRDREGEMLGAVMVFHDVTLRRKTQDIVLENEERLRTLIDALPDLVVLKDEQGRWQEANRYCRDILGLDKVDFRGKTDLELADLMEFHRRTLLDWESGDTEVWRTGRAFRCEETVARPDSGDVLFDVIKVPLFHPDGRRRGVVMVGRDITEAKRLDSRIRQLATVLEATPDYVGIIGANGDVLYMNRAFSSIVSVDGEQTKDVLQLVHPAWAQRVVTEEGIPTALARGVWRGETAVNWLDGRELPVSQVITAHKDVSGDVMFLATIMRDISERKEFERQLAHMTQFDMLTGLPNRLLFQDRLGLALAQAHRSQESVGVMFLDLDRFKNVNDTLGHAAGDELLQAVATRLKGCVWEGDTVARFGADEFTFILVNLARPQDAAIVAQKVSQALAPSFLVKGQEIFITGSMGIAIYPDDDATVDGLIKNADAAMYQAKRGGRNAYHFYTRDLNAKAVERLAMEASLRRALEREELELHYQPRVSLETGRITGMEALLRWHHPEQGMIPPSRFIPIAEETGLIVPIGAWVLHTACAENKAWQDAGQPHVAVAVNLSMRQFREVGLLETVDEALERSGLDPRYLELELTESLLMEDNHYTEIILAGFKRLGLRIALDDFGTGFSSLSYLKRFPIDQLKVDQSFVRDITTDPNDAAIVTAIVAMAHSLNIGVVAEGVETAEQLAFLRDRGCEEMQGYLFSRPVPAAEFGILLGSGKTLV